MQDCTARFCSRFVAGAERSCDTAAAALGAEWLGEDPPDRESKAISSKELADKPTANGWWSSRPHFPSGGEWSAQGVAAEAHANRQAAGASVRAARPVLTLCLQKLLAGEFLDDVSCLTETYPSVLSWLQRQAMRARNAGSVGSVLG